MSMQMNVKKTSKHVENIIVRSNLRFKHFSKVKFMFVNDMCT